MRQADICSRCAGLLSSRYILRRLTAGGSGQVRCANCGRLRIGSRYEIEEKHWEGDKNHGKGNG
mgnify:FL=1